MALPTRFRYALLAGLLLFITVATLNPDPFGNNPNIIGDESYFLTSSLNAIQKGTLPGWEFSKSGNYYGGVQTYIDTTVLVPAIGVMLAANHFSLVDTKMQIALHTGDLLAVLRFVNGLLFVAFCGFFLFYFARRKIPSPLGQSLLFLLFLLLGNSLVIGFVHTMKVWVLYMILDVAVGVLFIAQEYYLSRGLDPLIKKNVYIALMVWAATAAFFQNYVGVFPILLWILYAILLKHVRLREVWEYSIRHWYLFIALFVLNISFLYRAAFVKGHAVWWDPGVVAVMTPSDGIDWFHRLYDPIAYAVGSQPLVLLYIIGLITALFFWRRADHRKRLYLAIACLHPVLIYLIFHALLGFSLFPRYSLPLTIAVSFAIIMLLGEIRALRIAGLAISGVLALVVMTHAIGLYWKPSSETILTNQLETQFNSPHNVFIFEPVWPQATRLSLPLNSTSLPLLNERQQNMSRNQFQLQHLDAVDRFVSFKPVVVIPDTAEEEAAYLLHFPAPTYTAWTISSNCKALCSEAEMRAGTCIEINAVICGAYPQDIHTLKDFLSYTQLGSAYIVRRAN
ncbi:MAG: hypothetical protein NUV90_02285 [Candidatus Parcubacteria bacterium]|nr:hypothetical protein [Candidatus Parcubacteria bacterium]